MEALVKGTMDTLGATVRRKREANFKIWKVNKDMEKARSRMGEAMKIYAASDQELEEADEKGGLAT